MGFRNLPFFPEESWAANATGVSQVYDIECFKKVVAVLDVSFLGGGTPTLTGLIETSVDQMDWVEVETFSSVTPGNVPSSEVKTFSPLLRYVRARATLSTNPESEENPGQVFFSLRGLATD